MNSEVRTSRPLQKTFRKLNVSTSTQCHGHVSNFATSKVHMSVSKLFHTHESSSIQVPPTSVPECPITLHSTCWRGVPPDDVYNSTRLYHGQTAKFGQCHCSSSTYASFYRTYVRFHQWNWRNVIEGTWNASTRARVSGPTAGPTAVSQRASEAGHSVRFSVAVYPTANGISLCPLAVKVTWLFLPWFSLPSRAS